jgi:hypothetical protein
MQRLEALSVGKKFDSPEANEDSFVVIPGAGYAVIDGVTDRNGTRYGNMLSGRFAALLMQRAIEEFILAQRCQDTPQCQRYNGPQSFVDYLTERIRQAYVNHDRLKEAQESWPARVCCMVVAAFHIGERLEVVSVGDSGIRINGVDKLHVQKPLDDVTAILRRESWQFFAAAGLDDETCDRLASLVARQGTRHQQHSHIGDDVVTEVEKRALAAATTHLPNVPEGEIIHLIHHGVVNGQGRYLNRIDLKLGYGCLDGFPVPAALVEHRSYSLSDIRSIELFSDGYFKIGEHFGIESWESAFREVEAVDPRKLGPYLSVKGSTPTNFADDRTYLAILR